MSKIIAVCNQKGGVSKTTTTNALAVELAKRGYKVLALDGDQQASLSLLFGITRPDDLEATLTSAILAQIRHYDYDINDVIYETEEGVSLIPSSITMSQIEMELMNTIGREHVLKKILAPIRDNYDFILIDCPPSLGIITVNILTACDQVLIPVQASIFSVAGMRALLDTIIQVRENTNPGIIVNGIVFSMVQQNTAITKEVIKVVNKQYGSGLYIYDTMIPRSIKAENAASNLKSAIEYEPGSKLASSYISLTEEFIKRCEE